MGCAVSKSHKITDSSLLDNGQVEVIRSGRNLLDYFTTNDTTRSKCVFVFGGSGSQKGEFIWELMKQNDEPKQDPNQEQFVFAYIDVQFLIASKIKDRVIELIGEPEEEEEAEEKKKEENDQEKEKDKDEATSNCSDDDADIEDVARANNIQVDQVKPYLLEHSNIVSCSWVVNLIDAEIKRITEEQSEPDAKIIFLINLLPNRMNLFKNCLYLKQTPNFSALNMDYFAVNLVKHDHETKKDLDLVELSTYDEINANFLNYFRNINKLVDLRIEQNAINQLTIKLTRNKMAKKVSTPGELFDALKSNEKDVLELDIRNFTTSGKLKRHSSLIFFVDNQIDINDGEILLLIDPKETNFEAIRHLTQSIMEVKRSLRNSTQVQS